MYPQLAKLLPEFGESWSLPITSALKNAFGQVKAYDHPKLVKFAVDNGMLEPSDGLGAVDESDKVYGREFRLTNHGREVVGLKPWQVDKPVIAKKAEKTLFD